MHCVQGIDATIPISGMWTIHVGKCTWACHFAPVTFDLGVVTLNLNIPWKSRKKSCDTAVAKVLLLLWPDWVCQLPMRCRCAWAYHLPPVTFDLRDLILTLEILWQLLWPTYWCYIAQFRHVNYPWNVRVHGHIILPLWPLTLWIWPWPWKSWIAMLLLMFMDPFLVGLGGWALQV